MILYSITINIEKVVHDQWLDWIRAHHVPTILKTGLILDNKILKLFNEEENNTGITYSFQFFFRDFEALEIYQREFEPGIDNELYKNYSSQFVEFRTVLEVIE